MKKKAATMVDAEEKKIERRIGKGIRGVYTGGLYKLKRVILPAALAVCFCVLAYLSVDNALRSTSAYGVDTVTVYCRSDYEDGIDNFYKSFSKKTGVTLDYEEFRRRIAFQFVGKRQRLTIMERYDKSDGTEEAPVYILINENNEFIRAYDSMLGFEELLADLSELGYLEEE